MALAGILKQNSNQMSFILISYNQYASHFSQICREIVSYRMWGTMHPLIKGNLTHYLPASMAKQS